eukprot:EG_transcript_18438
MFDSTLLITLHHHLTQLTTLKPHTLGGTEVPPEFWTEVRSSLECISQVLPALDTLLRGVARETSSCPRWQPSDTAASFFLAIPTNSRDGSRFGSLAPSDASTDDSSSPHQPQHHDPSGISADWTFGQEECSRPPTPASPRIMPLPSTPSQLLRSRKDSLCLLGTASPRRSPRPAPGSPKALALCRLSQSSVVQKHSVGSARCRGGPRPKVVVPDDDLYSAAYLQHFVCGDTVADRHPSLCRNTARSGDQRKSFCEVLRETVMSQTHLPSHRPESLCDASGGPGSMQSH